MVRAHAVVRRGRLGLSVVERPHPGDGCTSSPVGLEHVDEHGWASARAETRAWPLHWFWIEAHQGSVLLESSPLPTVPVFLACTGAEVRAHWDPLLLYPFVGPRLDWEAAAYYLCTFDQPYSSRTVLADLHHLAGGYEASWRSDRQGWAWRRPACHAPSYPRVLRPAADPVGTFERLLESASARLVGSLPRVAAGLSGGLDSSLVAGALARLGHEVHSFGILVPDAERHEQRRRRQAVVERFGTMDHAFRIAPDYSPWSRLADEAGVHEVVPWDELYYAPFDQLYARAAASQLQVFFTGLGGDDLLAAYWDELPDRGRAERAALSCSGELPAFFTPRVRDARVARASTMNDAPRSFVQRSVMDSAAGMAAQALRHGLWPVHPLITPELVRYCHSLPREQRHGRRLMRDTLQRWRLPRSLSHPESTESFASTCSAAMRRCPVFARLLRAPRLADLGLVEPLALRRAFDDWCSRRIAPSIGLHFVAVATLEATLESLE